MELSSHRSGHTMVSVFVGIVMAVLLITVGVMLGKQLNNNNNIGSGSSSSSVAAMSSSAMSSESDTCITAATEAHSKRWADACADKKRTMEAGFNACMQKQDDEAYCTTQWGGYASITDTCDLGSARTNALTLQFTAAKQNCAK